MKGIAYQSYVEGTYSDATQERLLGAVEDLGANWMSFNTPFIYDPETGLITARRGVTDFDGLPRAILRAKQRGFKTALYIFVQTPTYGSLYAESSRPRNTDDFFRYFGNLVSGYADLAQREQVDLLILGNEMNAISGPAFRERWRTIVADVRGRFAGRIAYNAIPQFVLAPTLDTISQTVSFWEDLDYLGFSMWPSLTNEERPSRETAERGWTNSLHTNSNIMRNMKRWSELTGKPVIFVEIGYPSRDGAAIQPGQSSGGRGVPNGELQAMLLDVMFAQVSRESGSWLAGMFVWAVDTWNTANNPFYERDGYRAVDYSFIGKPGQSVVRRWFSGEDGRVLWRPEGNRLTP